MSDDILASQRQFYDERAPDYANPNAKPDRKHFGLIPGDVKREVVANLALTGDVLELACGTGLFTEEVAKTATTLHAVDASPAMLARSRERVPSEHVTFELVDLFDWSPDKRYDHVFFAFWLSHVPPDRFDDFWSLVRTCLKPGGRASFIDEDDRGAVHDDLRIVDGVPVAKRTLADGRTFDIVKIFWDPQALTDKIRALGWSVDIRRRGSTTMVGTATPTDCPLCAGVCPECGGYVGEAAGSINWLLCSMCHATFRHDHA